MENKINFNTILISPALDPSLIGPTFPGIPIPPIGFIPNDPYYLNKIETSSGLQNQWGLQRINPGEAFNIVKQIIPQVKLAVLDTGIDPNHPDLAEKIIDPINFSSDDPNDYIDTNGHGTHVAGIAAAITNNNIGIASASFNTSYIIPIKVLGETGTTEAIVQGILYSIEKGANVINMSIGSSEYQQSIQMALEKAWNANIVIVAAGGNDGHEQPSYPGANNFVLAVSATNQENNLASFSNWGVDIGIAAPGTDILSTTPTYPLPDILPNYDTLSGTSQATPFVSGVALILRTLQPQITNQKIIQIIQQSASKLVNNKKQWFPFYGYGLLNESDAVNLLLSFQSCNICFVGSFYGQAVDSNNNPIETVTITAISNTTLQEVRSYQTKSDGMFRLFNLPVNDTYSIIATLNSSSITLINDIQVVSGADIYLQLNIQ